MQLSAKRNLIGEISLTHKNIAENRLEKRGSDTNENEELSVCLYIGVICDVNTPNHNKFRNDGKFTIAHTSTRTRRMPSMASVSVNHKFHINHHIYAPRIPTNRNIAIKNGLTRNGREANQQQQH